MEVGAEFKISFVDFTEVGGDSVKLGEDGDYARDGGTEDRVDGTFTGGDGLESVRGEVLNQFGVHKEAIPGLREDFCQEGEGRRRLC